MTWERTWIFASSQFTRFPFIQIFSTFFTGIPDLVSVAKLCSQRHLIHAVALVDGSLHEFRAPVHHHIVLIDPARLPVRIPVLDAPPPRLVEESPADPRVGVLRDHAQDDDPDPVHLLLEEKHPDDR